MMVGRESELEALEGLLAACLRGAGGLAIVSGAPAMGKTTLLEAFARKDRTDDVIFLRASASMEEHHLPLEVIRQLFYSSELPGDEAEKVRELLAADIATGEGPQENRAGMRGPVLHGIWLMLYRLARNKPVIIMVDDVQHADPASLQCLLYISRRLACARILLILSECVPPTPEYSQFHVQATRQARCSQIALAPLSLPEVEAVIAGHLGHDVAHRLAPEYFEISGGNPLLVEALLSDHRAVGDHQAEVVPGAAFRRSILACLHRCNCVTLDVARAWAVLDEHASPELVERLLGPSSSAVSQVVAVLEMIGLLDRGWFRRDEAKTVILDEISAPKRADLHASVARLLYDSGAPITTVAEHLMKMGTTVDEAMVSVLQEAAHQTEQDSPELAIEYLRLAVKACTDKVLRVAIMNRIARLEWHVDPAIGQRRIADVISLLQDDDIGLRHAITPITNLFWHGRVAEAATALERLSDDESTLDEKAIADLKTMKLWLSYSYPYLFQDGVDASPAKDPTDDTGDSNPSVDPHFHGATLLADALKNADADRAVDGAEQLLQGTPLSDANVIPIVAALVTLVQVDRLDRAAFWCDLLLQDATRNPGSTPRALFSATRAKIFYRQGQLAAAKSYAQTALTLISPEGWGVVVGVPIAAFVLATTAMGLYEEAERYLNLPIPEATFQTPSGLHYLGARGEYRLATRRFHAALADFQACGDLIARWKLPTILPWRVGAAQANLKLNRPLEAKRLAHEQLAVVKPGNHSVRAAALRVLAGVSDVRDSIKMLKSAEHLFELSGDRLELATTIADLSDALYHSGDTGRARMAARRARLLAEECGAEPLRQRLMAGGVTGEAESTAAGPSPRIVDREKFNKLSDAEWRVTTLAAEGHTNTEIAKKLCITVSTVEQHLTRAYRKLGVNCRAALSSVLSSSA
jgi:DNA-binding CsgD family transcriptional regulator